MRHADWSGSSELVGHDGGDDGLPEFTRGGAAAGRPISFEEALRRIEEAERTMAPSPSTLASRRSPSSTKLLLTAAATVMLLCATALAVSAAS